MRFVASRWFILIVVVDLQKVDFICCDARRPYIHTHTPAMLLMSLANGYCRHAADIPKTIHLFVSKNVFQFHVADLSIYIVRPVNLVMRCVLMSALIFSQHGVGVEWIHSASDLCKSENVIAAMPIWERERHRRQHNGINSNEFREDFLLYDANVNRFETQWPIHSNVLHVPHRCDENANVVMLYLPARWFVCSDITFLFITRYDRL